MYIECIENCGMEIASQVVIGKDKTLIIKGLAILMMIVHHCLIKEFFVEPPEILSSFPMLRLQIGAKMCVGLFTFFVGYGFFFVRNVDCKYVFSHIWRVYRTYLVTLFITFSILLIFDDGFIVGGGKRLILNLLGLDHQYNLANWYLYFYVFAVVLLSLTSSLLNKMGMMHLIVSILICWACTYINTDKGIYFSAVHECTTYTPVLLIGYYCANTKILQKASVYISGRWKWFILAFIAFAGSCVASDIKGLSSNVVFVPLMVISVSAFFCGYENSQLAKVLTHLGGCSTMMWFIHTLPFNTVTRNIFQMSPFWVNNIIVIFLVVTIISYVIAFLYNKVVSKI